MNTAPSLPPTPGIGKTRARVVKLFGLAFVAALEAVELAPGYLPLTKPLHESIEGLGERGGPCLCCYRRLRYPADAFSPAVEDRHCH